ncbi:MAG: hypothetical protein ACE5MB_11700 [Anaerolineae bacterium]
MNDAESIAGGAIGAFAHHILDFTDTARRVARKGAQLIAVPSFDWPAVAAKHYSHRGPLRAHLGASGHSDRFLEL